MKNQKKLIILTGPSGVGKGTVVKEILGKEKNFWLSISATTREPREGEKDGENYYFLNQEKFKEMIEQNLFLEWAQFAGNTVKSDSENTYFGKSREREFLEILEICAFRRKNRDFLYILQDTGLKICTNFLQYSF